jgi:translation initiation factor IF-3
MLTIRLLRLARLATNDSILHPCVRVYDSHGSDLGIFKTTEAIALAQKEKADLVLVRSNPEPACVIGNKAVIEEQADQEEIFIKTSRFNLDPCNKVKRIQLSPSVDVKDFERKVSLLRYFLIERHRCEVVLTAPSLSVIARVIAELRDVGTPSEHFKEHDLNIKIWPKSVDSYETRIPLAHSSDSSFRPITRDMKREIWMKSSDPRLRRNRTKVGLDED